MKEVDVHIRRAHGIDDYKNIVELEKAVWGYTEPADIAAVPILMIANEFGGAVLVAEEPSGRLIGFAMANLGRRGGPEDRRLFWWSHMTAVIDEYRGKRIGLRLKMRQREEALAAGLDEIHWTFDPLQTLNANFNLHKLGVIVRRYKENVYGYSSSTLHRGLPTDRFIAEWRLNGDRMRWSGEDQVLIEIPQNINELRETNLDAAKTWQDRVRSECMRYFAEGYVVTDFLLEKSSYVLQKETRV